MLGSKQLTVVLLVTRVTHSDPDLIPDIETFIEDSGQLLDNSARDFSQIYTGWVNTSFIYPYYLKVSTMQLLFLNLSITYLYIPTSQVKC